MANYTQITATAQIKPAAGKLKGIFVSSVSGTPTITVYDSFQSSTSDPVAIATYTPTANTNHTFFDGMFLKNGLYIVLGGTVSATILYE